MHIQGFLEFVKQEFSLLLLPQELLFKQVNLSLQVRDTLGLLLCVDKLTFEGRDLMEKLLNLLLLLLIIDVTFI